MPAKERRDVDSRNVDGREANLTHYSKKRRPLDLWITLANFVDGRSVLSPPESADAALRDRIATAWESVPGIRPGEPATRPDYEDFYAVRKTLRAIVDAVRNPELRKPPGDSYTSAFVAGELPDIPTYQTRPRTIMLTGRGIVLSEDLYGGFLNVLQKSGESVYDLRLCPICSNVVLPRRRDQRACSPRCAKTLSVRESRSATKKKQYLLTRKRSRKLRKHNPKRR